MNTYQSDIEQQLREHYNDCQGKLPDTAHTWERIAPRLTSQLPPLPWWKRPFISTQPVTATHVYATRRPSPRLGLACTALLVLLIITGTTYAAISSNGVVELLSDLGFKPISQQFTDYHQTKSINGYSITLQKAFADSNRIIIGYTVSVPHGDDFNAHFAPEISTLTTEQGISLRLINGAGAASGANVFTFDGAPISGNPHELHLRLAIPYGSASISGPFHTDGYLTFNIAVPFHPGRVIPVHQAATALGHTTTLDRVVVTPSGIRLYVSGFTDLTHNAGVNVVLFSLNNGAKTFTGYIAYVKEDPWSIDITNTALLNQQSQWTLVAVGEHTTQNRMAPIPGGTWTFHFNVQ